MRYRFCTSALVGPWRETQCEALEDALKAGQARPDATGGQIKMLIGGIEQAEAFAVANGQIRQAA
jgi:hypothetical protein